MLSRRTAAFAAVLAAPLALPTSATAIGSSRPTHTLEVATVKADLRNLAVAEETYFTDHPASGYTTSMRKLRAVGYQGSKHTTVRVIWVKGQISYCLAGRYTHAGVSTRRSYDSELGGLEGPHFSCAAHKPAS